MFGALQVGTLLGPVGLAIFLIIAIAVYKAVVTVEYLLNES